jgi:hypothetical protein
MPVSKSPKRPRAGRRANLLTNGGFEIWQRGINLMSCPAGGGSNGSFCADRWQMFVQGTTALTVQATGSNDPQGSWRAANCVVTGGATPSNPAFLYNQMVSAFAAGEGQELRWRTLSLSMRVYGTVPNGCRVGIVDNTSGVSTYSTLHTGSGWETLRATSPISAGSVNAQARVVFEANGTYMADSAMLVVGNVPADYAPMHPADDLARCLRYYIRLQNGIFGLGQSGGASAYSYVQLPARLGSTNSHY